jgi:phosphohistidine phosphatase
MQILLLRHAEAEQHADTDAARSLTAKGLKHAESVGQYCLKHGFVPEMILSSPLTRAEETARLVARALDIPKRVRIEDFLRAGMTTEQALSGLRRSFLELMKREKSPNGTSVMLVGHEPDFSNLTGALIGGRAESVHFRKATLVGLTLQELKVGAGTIEFVIPVRYA